MIAGLRKALPNETCVSPLCQKPAVVVFRRWETIRFCAECARGEIQRLSKAIEEKAEERAALLGFLGWTMETLDLVAKWKPVLDRLCAPPERRQILASALEKIYLETPNEEDIVKRLGELPK